MKTFSDFSVFEVGDSFYDGYCRYTITKIRDDGVLEQLHTQKVSDKWGEWKGTYGFSPDMIDEFLLEKGYRHYKKMPDTHFDEDLFKL